ncbi:hypothetical protein H9L19_06500 [Weissella diestrammenae]|uniref:ABM domain-containing protein n=1 Tax=Weissella diestrammenae TaxID=1162633 RepID=A0A7G9T4K6_9LACO|nr:antibiotic biosynthesis monooxygenase [Weissella diestrammenae]MCM0582056.1 hypothetical protein [Weissella diestrammenae]QNN75031.1 hypothetical protein H9L19_06500 [Weissella diestrammenae]
MTQFIHTTFGSREVLKTIQAAHLDRRLFLTVDMKDPNRFQLIELNAQSTNLFVAGTTYEVLMQLIPDEDLRGMMQWQYLTLNDDEAQSFIRRAPAFAKLQRQQEGLINFYLLQVPNSFDYAILTTWVTKEAADKFQPVMAELMQRYTGSNSSKYNLRSRQFSFATLTK